MTKIKAPGKLACIMPWKAFFMDHFDGELRILPCCADWITSHFGEITQESTVESLWNSPQAQEIRYLLNTGRQAEICSPDCHWLNSGRYGEENLRILEGPATFVDNQKLNNREIRERKLVLESRPMVLRIIPTLRCNSNCRMCYQDHKMALHLPELFKNNVSELFPYLYDYQLHGGEVLIAKDFPDWVAPEQFAANPQLRLSLITNGTVIPDRARQVLEQVRINYITVSLNAATRGTYRYVTQIDFFDRVLSNVVYLRDLGRSHRVADFPVYLSFVIMRSTYRELPDFVRLANRLGVPFHLLLIVGNRSGESTVASTRRGMPDMVGTQVTMPFRLPQAN